MVVLADMGHVEPRFGLLEIVLVLVQDRSIVCTQHITGLEIILDKRWNC
jgi:hypothetical protein